MLGLEVDLERSERMEVTVGHTEDRRNELVTKISDILAEDFLDPKEAERLRGRMVFFEGYSFGRNANAAVKSLSKFCVERGGRKRLDDTLRKNLLLLRDRVLSAPPITIGRQMCDTWIIFTDGACSPENKEGSIGGLIISPCGVCHSYFSEAVPEKVLTEFFKFSKNPIHELEVLPVLAACDVWGTLFAGALIVYYIDNESSRMAFVKGSGETVFATTMVHNFVCLESKMQHRTWFGRCPSHSNPSDGASRLITSWFEERGVSRTVIDWERLGLHLELGGVEPDR